LTVLEKIKSFFKLPKSKTEQTKPAAKAAEKKLPEAPKKQAGKSRQQSTGTT